MVARQPIKLVIEGQPRALAMVPASVVQARRLAREYAADMPTAELLIKRGDEVLDRIEPADKDEAA